MSSQESGYRQKLNNELQRIGDLPNLRYEFATVGPLHQATWTATATIWGTIYGTGVGNTKADAKEAAAEAAYRRLLARP